MMAVADTPHECWWCGGELTTNGKRLQCQHCDRPCGDEKCRKCARVNKQKPREK